MIAAAALEEAFEPADVSDGTAALATAGVTHRLRLHRERARARQLAAQALRASLRLPPRITLSQWADKYRVLGPPSAEQGPWRTDRAPYLREIMDEISAGRHQDFTIVKCSQSGGTEVINNGVGFYIDQEPSPQLVIQPNVRPMAEAWSKDRLAGMIRDTPKLRGKVKEAKGRNSGNTLFQKDYAGGSIAIVGANSPAGLASRPIRCVWADELDRWKASAGTEGDPLALAEARMTTYRHRARLVKVSTPGNAGESRIEKEWAKSDQRHYYVPCPHCREYQVLEWRDSGGQPDIRAGRGAFRLVWEKEVGDDGEVRVHRPETAQYLCAHCACLIDESHKPAMLAAGKWVKHNPTSDRAGWFISGLLSPWVRWRNVAKKWLAAMDDVEQRKAFFNTVLGLLYEVEGETPDAGSLAGRRESYGPEGVEVPDGVGVLTAAVDVQMDRLEVEVRGWGAREESWQIRYERIYGDPELDDSVWQQLDAILLKQWQHASGRPMRIRATFVDSGYLQDRVFRFVRPRQARRVYAVQGRDNAREPLARSTRAGRDGVKAFTLNPTKFKDVLFARLRRTKPGPGYLHFGPAELTGMDDRAFEQYGAEKRVVKFVHNAPRVSYEALPGRRNELIDLYDYNLGALRSLGMTVSQALGALAQRMRRKPKGAAAEASPAPGAGPNSAPNGAQPAPLPGDDRGDGASGSGRPRPAPAPPRRPAAPPRTGGHGRGGWVHRF